MNAVQMKELAIYKEIAKICVKHNLNYFAIGGTCLGTVRHKGFIPWDDDIDIALPRKDYELFRTKYYKELPQHLQKLDEDNCKQHVFLFMKIHDSTTTFVESYAKNSPNRYTGAFVDIMPIDGLPVEVTEKNKTIRKFKKMCIFNWRCRPVPLSLYNSSFLGFLKYFGHRMCSKIFRYNYYSTKIKNLGERYNFYDSEECIFTWRIGDDLSIKRIVFPKNYFDEIIEVPFEDTTMKIPKMYDDYLKQDYGDYMKLPPIEEQTSIHNVYINDMDTPCSFYAKRDFEAYKNKYKFWR